MLAAGFAGGGTASGLSLPVPGGGGGFVPVPPGAERSARFRMHSMMP